MASYLAIRDLALTSPRSAARRPSQLWAEWTTVGLVALGMAIALFI